MKRIEFNHIVPAAFSHEDNTSSEIWCKDMVFERAANTSLRHLPAVARVPFAAISWATGTTTKEISSSTEMM